MDRLSIGDLSAFWADRPNAPMHVALAGTFAPVPAWFDDGRMRLAWLRGQVEARTRRAPLFRRRLHRPWFGEGLPLWVEDGHFDIRCHVHATDDCAGMTFAEFADWAGQAALAPLDRDRPLWRLTFAPGLADGSVGMLVTVHHVAVDGLTGVAALSSLLDTCEDGSPAEPTSAAPPAPTSAPGHRVLLVDNARRKAGALGALARHRPRLPTSRQPGSEPRPSMWSMLKERAPDTPLSGPVSSERRTAVITVPLDAAMGAAHTSGATVNDLVLSALTAGLRDWLLSLGEPPGGLTLRCSVPVSVPGGGQNQGRLVIAPLPVGEPDPAARLALITATTDRLKRTGADVSHTEVTNNPLFPVSLARAIVGGLAAQGSRWVNCYVTNVRGPREQLWLAGAPLTRAAGIASLVAGIRLGVTVFSYAGLLSVTLLGDAQVPGWPALVAGTEREIRTALRRGSAVP